MYFDPYFRRPAKSFVRLFHASPDAPAVDIYLGDQLVARNLSFKEFTQYLSVAPGTYNVRAFPTGVTTNPVINTSLTFKPNAILTVAAADRLKNIKLLPFEEPKLPSVPGKSYIRFVHLSPNTPAVDISLPNGNTLFRDISFREASNYIPVSQGTYTIQAAPTGTTNVVLNVPNIRIRPNRTLTFYAVGLSDGKPPLQVLIPLDGSSYIDV
ncbi:DUF4397 domain-containing protein [Clostridium bovifaecis]|uniref:DUF4397 domain-containing protein n=1 Tax=Clostridium bovifaecis TaxID=2184719 RepID=A0A6I6ETQ0_9CLOT|nr:DUF4397 domain-containing protein [Clostridium bovifaecis]